MNLKGIYCQDRVISSLQRAFKAGKMAHAYIFAGPDGVGKFTTAQQWAKMLLCHKKKEEDGQFDSCQECESCRLFNGGGHPDFNVVYKELLKFTKEGKRREPPLELPKSVIDEFLIEKVAVRPGLSDYTVYIVKEAEKLNVSSQNALLKVLEEPPSFCVIILLCSRLENMLPTTQSRCQVARFGPIDEEHIVSRLQEMGLNKQQALYWSRFSQGSIGTAIDWASLELKNSSCYEIKKDLIQRLSALKLVDVIDFAEWLLKSAKIISSAWIEKEPDISKRDIARRVQKTLIMMIVSAVNDAMKLNIGANDKLINSDQIKQIEIIGGRFDPEAAAAKINKAYENIRWIDANVNEKLIFEELLLNYYGCSIISNSAV